jgi:hypothetical protein
MSSSLFSSFRENTKCESRFFRRYMYALRTYFWYLTQLHQMSLAHQIDHHILSHQFLILAFFLHFQIWMKIT